MDSWEKEEFVALSESEMALRIFQAEQESEKLNTHSQWNEINELERKLKRLRADAEYNDREKGRALKSITEMRKLLSEKLASKQ